MVRYEQPSRWKSLKKCCQFPISVGCHRHPFKPQFVRLLVAVLFWLLSFTWMLFCVKVAGFRTPKQNEVLPDLLFTILPAIDLDPMPDVILYVLLMSLIFRVIFHPRGLSISRRFMVICGCVYIIRSLTLIVTSFPAPQTRCKDYQASWTSFSCGDVMYGGTSVILMLVALCWTEYTKSIVARCVIWMVSTAGMLSLVIARYHYTLDLLISILVTSLTWMHYHHLLALATHPKYKNRIVAWFEVLDGETAVEVTSNQLFDPHKSYVETELSDVKSPTDYHGITSVVQLGDYHSMP